MEGQLTRRMVVTQESIRDMDLRIRHQDRVPEAIRTQVANLERQLARRGTDRPSWADVAASLSQGANSLNSATPTAVNQDYDPMIKSESSLILEKGLLPSSGRLAHSVPQPMGSHPMPLLQKGLC